MESDSAAVTALAAVPEEVLVVESEAEESSPADRAVRASFPVDRAFPVAEVEAFRAGPFPADNPEASLVVPASPVADSHRDRARRVLTEASFPADTAVLANPEEASASRDAEASPVGPCLADMVPEDIVRGAFPVDKGQAYRGGPDIEVAAASRGAFPAELLVGVEHPAAWHRGGPAAWVQPLAEAALRAWPLVRLLERGSWIQPSASPIDAGHRRGCPAACRCFSPAPLPASSSTSPCRFRRRPL